MLCYRTHVVLCYITHVTLCYITNDMLYNTCYVMLHNTYVMLYNTFYYMEKSVLLGTKPLVDSIRHFIRDPSGVFSVCHLCECRIVQ